MASPVSPFPPTVIIRHPRENKKKCTVIPLKDRPDIVLLTHPAETLPDLTGYVRLCDQGPPLSAADAGCGLLLLDGSWRRVADMLKYTGQVPARSLSGYRTAYPRVSRLGTDPDNGLASVEALFLAYHLLGRAREGLLDDYHWAAEFLRANGLEEGSE